MVHCAQGTSPYDKPLWQTRMAKDAYLCNVTTDRILYVQKA